MKLTDISKTALREAVNQEAKETGFLTEDLLQIAEANNGKWSEPMTSEQLLEQVNTWLAKK